MAPGSFNATIVNSSGEIVPGAEVEVRRTSDNALATLFSDASRTAITNPFNANATTAFAQFFAERDTYTVAASTGAGIVTWTVDITPSSDGATYAPTRAEALLLNVPDAQDILFVRSGVGLLAYKRDASSTALTTADGQRWSPDGDVYPDHWAANTTPGTTDMQAALVGSVAYCFIAGRSLRGGGQYLASGNVPNLWDVQTVGGWFIARGSDVWHSKPTLDQENVIYIDNAANGATTAKDGLTANQPTTIRRAFDILQEIGEKAAGGIWRIQLPSATLGDAGILFEHLPAFTNPLRIWGRDATGLIGSASDYTSVPTSIWDGVAGGGAYAIRGDSVYRTASKYLDIQNIKFTNWSSGAVVLWNGIDVSATNLHTDQCPIAFWYRTGYVRQTYGRIENASVWGIGAQYNCSINIGGLSGQGVTFNAVDRGATVGRSSTMYVQGCTFTNITNHAITTEWLSRVRTQANDFRTLTVAPINSNGNSLWTGDNDAGNPDLWPTTTPASGNLVMLAGSVNPRVARYSQKTLHKICGLEEDTPAVYDLSGTTSLTHLAAVAGDGFTPFRLPAFFLSSPTCELEVSIGITCSANQGGTLSLHGQGSSGALLLASLVIPAEATDRRGIANLRFYKRPRTSLGRYESSWRGGKVYTEGAIGSLNSPLVIGTGENLLIFRLYWTPLTTGLTTFFDMRTWVTE